MKRWDDRVRADLRKILNEVYPDYDMLETGYTERLLDEVSAYIQRQRRQSFINGLQRSGAKMSALQAQKLKPV